MQAYKQVMGWKGSVIPPSTLEQPFKYYGICYDPKKTETRTERVNVDGEIVEKQVPGPWVYGIKDLKVMDDDGEDDVGEKTSEADLTSMMSNMRVGNVPLENRPELINSVQQFGGHINSDSLEAFTMLMLDRMRPQNGCDITHVRNIERVLQHTLESVIQRKQLFMQSTRNKANSSRGRSAKRPRVESGGSEQQQQQQCRCYVSQRGRGRRLLRTCVREIFFLSF